MVLIADGVRPDVLARAIARGELPALAGLREEGSLSTVTSAFPSVTGPAYAPFIMGRYPGSIGLPGLRWYDRSRRIAKLTGHARSYVGPEMRLIDRDIDRASPTIFELAKPSLGALSVISRGQDSPIVHDAMRIVDDTVAQIRHDAERDGRWNKMHLWVGSDHGHSSVREHEDLTAVLTEWGYSTLSHPWAFNTSADVAVMVSGNAMAHLYLDLDQKTRPWWPALGEKWGELVERLSSCESVDLLILPTSPSSCEIRSASRGSAKLTWGESRYDYTRMTGDPLDIGAQKAVDDGDAYAATIESDYPDALVQIAHLVGSARSGDIILSAARDWDYRAKYEPIPHVSSHGALHREHMLVPLLLNRPPLHTPRRTVDVMPSALAALGITPPKTLDGVSFF